VRFRAPLQKCILKTLLYNPKSTILNDQLVEELYGEIRNFFALPLETKHSYEPRYWWATRLCFFGTEHAKGRKEGDLKEFCILVTLAKIQNMFRIPRKCGS
jgi:isopenicillin N synthase-like dioxygenase